MTKLEQELLSKIESGGVESIKENLELWIYLNEKRVVRKERLIPEVSSENLEQLNEGVPRKERLISEVSSGNLEQLNKGVPKPPKPPLSSHVREGTIGTCPKCRSTEIKRFIWFGESIGCINPECENYSK